MQELAPEFERATGHKVVVRYGLAAAFKQQIDGGEAFDVVVLTPPLIDDAIKILCRRGERGGTCAVANHHQPHRRDRWKTA
jgi:hypothetical protein